MLSVFGARKTVTKYSEKHRIFGPENRAILNELVWRTQTEEFWVNFKVWGLLPITILFTAFQVSLVNRYKKNE